jgi:Zn-dependent peptidase ImmA (M78 family)
MSIKPPWYKRDNLEKIASGILLKYSCSDPPIDIDFLVEMEGLNLSDIKGLKRDFGVFGLLARMKNEYVIFVDKGDLKLTNYNTNFTIAEELAHFILHSEYFKIVKSLNDAVIFYTDFVSQESKMVLEFNAKYLAGAILLPKNHLQTLAIKTFEKNRATFNEVMKSGNLDLCEDIIDAIATSLIDVYKAPAGIIAYRLKSEAIGLRKYIKEKYKTK